jgi:hypothetical protein
MRFLTLCTIQGCTSVFGKHDFIALSNHAKPSTQAMSISSTHLFLIPFTTSCQAMDDSEFFMTTKSKISFSQKIFTHITK